MTTTVLADGKLIQIPQLTLTVFGITVRVEGTVEVLDIRKRLPADE